MIFTPGNVITLGICLVLVILFRQMDKDNRSIEKVKKFGDRLKDELDLFIKQRMTALDESAVALNVEQTKAVAAVKRLESIRDDLTNRENELLERTRSIADIGKQLDGYDATIRQLLEMTALAETNLSKITSESDFCRRDREETRRFAEAARRDLGGTARAPGVLRPGEPRRPFGHPGRHHRAAFQQRLRSRGSRRDRPEKRGRSRRRGGRKAP